MQISMNAWSSVCSSGASTLLLFEMALLWAGRHFANVITLAGSVAFWRPRKGLLMQVRSDYTVM